MPETNFPIKPKNRWTGWVGTLQPGDEFYIFTESVYVDLFERVCKKGRKYGKEIEDCEDIANEVIEKLYVTIQKLCDKKTTIVKSISSLCWAWIHIYFNNIMSQEGVSTPYFVNETLFTETIADLADCIKKLDKESQTIIESYYFSKLTLEEIAQSQGLSLNKVFRIKVEAERALYHCMRNMGYP